MQYILRHLMCGVLALFAMMQTSCQSKQIEQPQKAFIDPEDRQIVEDFLQYIGIFQPGLYTILGSKPMSEFSIPRCMPEPECKQLYEKMPEAFQKSHPFDTFFEVSRFVDAWVGWQKIQSKYLGPDFRITRDREIDSVFLINVPLTLYALESNYDDFVKVLGKDFDPQVAVSEIGNASSDFWPPVRNDHYLLGILFGFGKQNARFFVWEREKKVSFPFRIGSTDLMPQKKLQKDASPIEFLTIPPFIVYQPADPIVEKYRAERERIMQIYEGKDFAELTIRFLKGEGVEEIPTRRKRIPLPSLKEISKNKQE